MARPKQRGKCAFIIKQRSGAQLCLIITNIRTMVHFIFIPFPHFRYCSEFPMYIVFLFKQVCSMAWHPIHETLMLSGGYNGSLIYWIAGQNQVRLYFDLFALLIL